MKAEPRKRNRRFTDTMKWDNKEFRGLPPLEKLLFMWLCDDCDMAGCLEWDAEKVEFETKLTDCNNILKGLLQHCDSIESNGDLLWLRNHIEVQGNLNMSPKNNVYKPLYEAIKRNACNFEGLADMLKELTSPLQAPSKVVTRENSNSDSNSDIGLQAEAGLRNVTDVTLESFERCWKEYPNKAGSKHKALQAYKQAKPNEADVLAGIERYKAYVEAERRGGFKELKYRNGQTWFNGRGWETEYETAKRVDPTAPRYAPPVKWEHATPETATGRPE